MKLGIANRAAIVTGAANGIGAAIAGSLAAEGARVLLADLNPDRLEDQVLAIRAAGGIAEPIIADVTNAQDVGRMAGRCMDLFGGIGILVNNAGFTRDMGITRMQESDWDAVVDVILKGAFLCTRAVIPFMRDTGWGRVVNISSRAHLGNPGQANYSAAKAGLIGFTRSQALEQGRHSITVNAVAPGIIDTEAVRGLAHFEKIRDAAEKTTPIPRIGSVEDVASAVSFLVSDQAGYITGELLHVTGGRY